MNKKNRPAYKPAAIGETIGFGIALVLVTALLVWGLFFDFTRTMAGIALAVIWVPLVGIVSFAFLKSAGTSGEFARSAGSAWDSSANVGSAKRTIESIVTEHIETLARRRLATIKVDHYGVVDGTQWNAEVQYFVDKVVRPKLTYEEAVAVAAMNLTSVFQEMIEDRVRIRADAIEAEIDFSATMTPFEFERWCARLLTKQGWKAVVTKLTGDQGADVLAEKGPTRIILQCKLYTASVGNEAVQQAYAAQRHYAAHASAVVSNASFTRAAVELANTTGVLLLHYSDLDRLSVLLQSRGLS